MSKWRPLTVDLRELEATNPAVRKASEDYDHTVWRILFWRRANERRATEGKSPIGPYSTRSSSTYR